MSVKENNTVKQVMEAVEKYLQNMLYCAVMITNCVRIMRKSVSLYINSEKAGRNLQYIYSDSDTINDNGKRENPDCKPDYSWNTLLSFNYIGNVFAVKDSFSS